MRLFEVGGHIRDELMGIESNDIDYTVEADSYESMRDWVFSSHEKVFFETPDKFTIRALKSKGDARDYVLARKEGPYSDGRRPDWVKPGTIEDDLARRDFTVNALAREVDTSEIMDLFGGVEDIKTKTLRAVGSAHDRFEEDSLRVLRAIRFIVTKGFSPDEEIRQILDSGTFSDKLSSVSTERIREELLKCMKFDTPATIMFLSSIHSSFTDAIFSNGLWLEPTMKSR